MKCGPESAAKFKILIVSLDSNHSLEQNLLENEYKWEKQGHVYVKVCAHLP